MSDAQSTWHLDGGRALTLAAGAEARRVSVARGRVWLTLSGTPERPAEDTWLEAGQTVALAPGQTAVLEGWPAADFEVLVPPAAAVSRPARSGSGFLLGRSLFAR
jgi:ferric-dicitrate binding protein FerR (iron transport regulator)